MPLEPGDVVDQYRLDQTIHRDRATIVYAATDLGLGRKVAFKVLADRYATDDVIRQRFVNEAQVAASLDGHPNIVTVYKWGEFEGSMYFVTELIDGINLVELVERPPGGWPLAASEALGLLAQIADALDFAHKRGAIHRDVKPANVMVRMTDTPKTAYLVDFGITKMDDGESGPQGMFLGTPDYASPEQISGAQALDRRSDVYSLACTAFEVLVGRPPFGDAPNDAARIAAHLQSPIPSACSLRPDLPPEVDRIFAKALAKNRANRYRTCTEFVGELRAAFPETAHTPSSGADLPVPSLYTPDMAPRRKWPWVVVGVAFALLATTIAYFVTSSRDPGIVKEFGGELTPWPTTRATTTTATTTTTPTTTTTSTMTTTTTPTARVLPAPFGPVGPPVAASDSPAAAYAVGIQSRQLGTQLARPGSAAMLYAEWIRLVTGGQSSSGPVRRLDDDGFLVEADETVALLDVHLGAGGTVTDVRECRVKLPCVLVSDRLIMQAPCDPAAGCPTVDSDTGLVRAIKIATLLIREPQQNLIYQLRTEQRITRVSEPDGNVFWDGESSYFAVQLDASPDQDPSMQLTITYADGATDQLTMAFNAPAQPPTGDPTTTTG